MVIALGMIIVHEYISAVFMFIVVFLIVSNDFELNRLQIESFSIKCGEIFDGDYLFSRIVCCRTYYSSSGITDAQIFQDLIAQFRMTMFVSRIGNGMRYLV